MTRRHTILCAALGAAVAGLIVFHERVAIAANMVRGRIAKKTVADRLAEFGPAARQRLRPDFQKAGVPFPPKRVVLVALKDEKTLEVYAAAGAGSPLKRIRRHPILAASGGPGPKLRAGDRQVPEGIYRVESLNPNSAYHVSLRLNYPNEFDRAQAAKDGRTDPGGDIMIHGKAVSIGCLAMGDEAAEDLFTLAAETGLAGITVVCCPTDFRKHPDTQATPGQPSWVPELYRQLAKALPAP